jgi:hypothetical protein
MDAPSASIPRTLREARDFDLSQTTRAAIELAGQIAAAMPAREGRPRAIGLAELIAGLVAVGEREREQPRAAEGRRGALLIAAAMAEALEGLAGPSRIAEVVAQAKPLVRGVPDAEVVLSPRVTEALVAARGLAEATVARTRIDARHLIVALVAPDEPRLAAALRRVWRREWAISPDSLRGPILAAIERNLERGENLAAWRQILGVPRIAPAAFAADAPAAGDDALGRRADARRLAELACLADNAPPLAIGLFGDWGSGKSTFMAMMQGEIERIGAAWKDDATSPFATRVAQIRFNAWSFADANLWASLAVEIFEGLRDEIARIEGTGNAQSRRAATLLAEISARSEQAKAARDAANAAVADARAALVEVEQRLKALDEKLAGPAAVAARVGEIVSARRDDITALLRDLGVIGPRDEATAVSLAAEARMLAAAGRNGLAVARRVVRLASSRWLISLCAGLLLAAGLFWLGVASGAATMLAVMLPFAAKTVAALNRLSPLLDAVEAEEKAEADLRRERAALAEAREAAARALAEREAAAAKALTGAEAIEKAAATPQAMLRFFLNESDELRGYESEIGLIGRLRRSFQRLDDLMAAQADPRRETRDDLPVLDRIILYIDDLDRLREDQVVKVLEAVALLLQFRLFVVVVAVDARWLEGALKRFYAGQLSSGQVGPGDYLEKIFQIPFWLSSLQGGRTFCTLAEKLMPEALDTGPMIEEPAAAAPSAAGTMVDSTYAIDPAELPQPDDNADTASLRTEVLRVELTKPEARALRELLPLAASTPRAAKRFINLYRLARASHDDAALRRFLGDDGSPPLFPAFALMLACQNGLRASQLPEFQRYVRRMPQDGDLSGMANFLITLSNKQDDGEVFLRSMQSSFWSGYSAVLEPNILRAALEEASRYSFHPPTLDRAPSPANPAAEQPGSTA